MAINLKCEGVLCSPNGKIVHAQVTLFNKYLFTTKVIEVIRHPTERAESGRGSGSGSTPADEERYRELVKENEELQKLIAQV